MRLVPQPGIEPTSPALQSGFLTTGPPENYRPPSHQISFLWEKSLKKRNLCWLLCLPWSCLWMGKESRREDVQDLSIAKMCAINDTRRANCLFPPVSSIVSLARPWNDPWWIASNEVGSWWKVFSTCLNFWRFISFLSLYLLDTLSSVKQFLKETDVKEKVSENDQIWSGKLFIYSHCGALKSIILSWLCLLLCLHSKEEDLKRVRGNVQITSRTLLHLIGRSKSQGHPRFKERGNRFHILMGGVEKWYCKGPGYKEDEGLWSFS